MSDLSKQGPSIPYRVDQPETFVEGIEAPMLNEVNPIELDHVYLASELYFIYFLATNKRPDVSLGDRYDSASNGVTALGKQLLLLDEHLANHPFL